MYRRLLTTTILTFSLLSTINTPCLSAEPMSEPADIVIKSTTNRDETNIGDYWIGEDFAEGFRNNGLSATVDYRGEYQTKHTPEPKINVYMRGYTKFTPPFPKGCNVLYVYYPMVFHKDSKNKLNKAQLNTRPLPPENTNLDDDWQNYDILAVASKSYAEKLNQNGIKAIYTPQFTNTSKFYPEKDYISSIDSQTGV